MNFQRIALAPFALFSVLVLAGCQRTEAPSEEQLPLVKVTPVVEDKDFSNQVKLVGTVVPLHRSRVASDVAGRVIEFPLREGAMVGKDQLLARLRDDTIQIEIKAAEAAKKKAAAALSLAEKRSKRVAKLRKQGTVNQENLDTAQSEAEQAQAALEAASYEVDRLRDNLSKHEIKPPFSGDLVVMVEQHTDVGEWVEEGGQVATLVDLSQVEVIVTVEEKYIDLVRIGGKVNVRFDALARESTKQDGKQTATREGEIVRVVPRSNWLEGSRSFPVHIRVKNSVNADGRPVLKEGMLARLTFTGPKRTVLKVHKDCIVRSSGKPVVYKIDEQQRAQAVEIETGVISDDYFEVVAVRTSKTGGERLVPGDALVTDGAERLRPLQEVKVMTE